jgi:CBS domain-containing protein
MDILAFIKPKHEVIYVRSTTTIKEALAKMEEHRFASIPIIDQEGKYFGTLTEGDLLWELKRSANFDISKAENIAIGDIHRHRDYLAINSKAEMVELIAKAAEENFVPVVDDSGHFVGIITRKTILNYFFEHNFIVL